eukprot:sb/3465031/
MRSTTPVTTRSTTPVAMQSTTPVAMRSTTPAMRSVTPVTIPTVRQTTPVSQSVTSPVRDRIPSENRENQTTVRETTVNPITKSVTMETPKSLSEGVPDITNKPQEDHSKMKSSDRVRAVLEDVLRRRNKPSTGTFNKPPPAAVAPVKDIHVPGGEERHVPEPVIESSSPGDNVRASCSPPNSITQSCSDQEPQYPTHPQTTESKTPDNLLGTTNHNIEDMSLVSPDNNASPPQITDTPPRQYNTTPPDMALTPETTKTTPETKNLTPETNDMTPGNDLDRDRIPSGQKGTLNISATSITSSGTDNPDLIIISSPVDTPTKPENIIWPDERMFFEKPAPRSPAAPSSPPHPDLMSPPAIARHLSPERAVLRITNTRRVVEDQPAVKFVPRFTRPVHPAPKSPFVIKVAGAAAAQRNNRDEF